MEQGYFKPDELTLIKEKDIKFVQEKVHHRFKRNKGKYKLVKYLDYDE